MRGWHHPRKVNELTPILLFGDLSKVHIGSLVADGDVDFALRKDEVRNLVMRYNRLGAGVGKSRPPEFLPCCNPLFEEYRRCFVSMGRWRRFALISAAAAASVALIACGSTEPPPAEKAEMPLEQTRVERGRYIAENLALCEHCHSEIDWAAPGTPPVAGKAYAGALFPDEGVPFKVVVPNITPDIETGIGAWTDEELGRAIREGVSRDGRRLFPLMPYMNYRQMSNEDLASVIAYLRSVPPVRNALAKNEFPEPVKAIFPPHQPITAPVPQPGASQHGAYLVTLASCVVCHTPMDKQFQPIMPLAFAGGFVMKGPWGEVASGNITPDASGISYYDEERFLQVMKTGDVGGRQLNVMMPSSYYRHLTDEDLKAMYAFILILPPVEHRVDNTEEAAPCERCGGRHGLGAGNRGKVKRSPSRLRAVGVSPR